MNKKILFAKYTTCGNSFVIIDEIPQARLSEKEKPLFAYRASDVNFGIGADGLLIIQRFQKDSLQTINDINRYWKQLPAVEECDFIFRLFETNGKEALSCGNGLLSIASYLGRSYGIRKAHVMTEVPLTHPNIITLGSYEESALSWCNMGYPRRAPGDVVSISNSKALSDEIDAVDELEIDFRSHDLKPFTDVKKLLLSGYVVFTGEPHLVFFLDEQSLTGIADTLFVPSESDTREKRRNFGSWLINHIGAYINKHYQHYFPAGINVNFARIDNDIGVIHYRCYERGIDRETLACGTGALAVSYIAQHLRGFSDNKITLCPHRCSWYQPEARLWVEVTAEGWLLMGSPLSLFSGEFPYVEISLEAGENAASWASKQNLLPPVLSTYNEPVSVF